MAPQDRRVDGEARGGRAGSAGVLLVVAGVVLAAGLAGGDDGAARTDEAARDTAGATSTERRAPVFRGLDAVPPLRPGALDGTLLLGLGACRTATFDLARLEPAAELPDGCPLATSPDGRLTLVGDGGTAQVVDVRRGRTLVGTPLRAELGAPPTVAVDDDGASASCEDDRIVLRPRVGPYRSVPGCEPVSLASGLHWLADPTADGLPLVDARGRPRRFGAKVLRETGPPYRLTASPGGRFLGAIAFHPALSRHVLVVRASDGHIVGRRAIDPVLDPSDVRVAADGAAAAVLVRTDDAPQGRAWFLLRLDRRAPPVRQIGRAFLADVAFSPDGRHLAALTQDPAEVVVLDATTFGPIARVPLDRAARASRSSTVQSAPDRVAWVR